MALWSIHDHFAPLNALNISARKLKLASLAGICAATALPLLWLLPASLFLPALSIVSFVLACGSALVAHCFHVDHRDPDLTAWDIAVMFTLIWIGAAIASGPGPIINVFERLITSP